jgi:UDP-glucose 4-epimerase
LDRKYPKEARIIGIGASWLVRIRVDGESCLKKITPSTCLITGGAGFIASHLAETLLAEGHRVLAIDNFSTGSWNNIAHLGNNPNFQFARSSIEDPVVLDRMASQSQVIFHLAAAVGVKLIVEQPVHTIETNIMGTEYVLKAAVRYRCRTIIASTSEVYGKGSKVPFGEDDDVLLGSTAKCRWAYAASKMVDEFLGLAYCAQYGAEITLVRLFNTVGPRQTGQYGMVVPRLVQQALRNEPLTVYGDGKQSRCFCDVRDVVKALTGLAGHAHAHGRVYNIGSTEEISIFDLAERVIALTGSSSKINFVPFHEAYAPGFEDMQRRVPDISRVNKLLGWGHTRSLDEILKSIIEYERHKTDQK